MSTTGRSPPDGHWRESVLCAEVLRTTTRAGEIEPLSAITVRSLADMGYLVDVNQADAYTLPARSAGAGARTAAAAAPPPPPISRNCIVAPAIGAVDGRRERVVPAPVMLRTLAETARVIGILSGCARPFTQQ